MAKNSNIVLSKNILIDKEGKNRLSYGNGAMLELMRSQAHLVAQAANYSFIDSNVSRNQILVGFTYEQCLASNYIAFQNPRYSAKWFFAFIDKVYYNSDASTIIEFTIDSFTTWYDMFIGSMKPCYVMREHTNNDAIGANTIQEDLAVGEIIAENDGLPIYEDTALDSDLYVAVATNWDPANKTGFTGIVGYTKTVMGNLIHLFALNDSGLYQLEHYLFLVGGHNKTNDIHDIFIIPQKLISSGSTTQVTASDIVAGVEVTSSYYELRYDSVDAYRPIETEIIINKKHTFSDFIPKNNKVYCYPYNYLYVTNNVGSNHIYKYENFIERQDTIGKCRFYLQLALSVGVSGRIEPIDYRNINENLDESLTLGKYPTCSWSTDAYTNWLTQQAVNLSQKYLGNDVTFGISRFGEVFSGALEKTGNAIVSAVGGALGQFSSQQLMPENEAGTNTGDVNFSAGNMAPCFYYMRAKTEYLRIIDDYFTRFGYKTLRVKVPNVTGRQNFNYIEIGTGERFAFGEIPPEAIEEINQMARNGLTIWHNHANVGNYTIANGIVS